MSVCQKAGLLSAFACGAAAALAGQAIPLFPGDFQANVFTTGEQRRTAVASPGDGSFVVVWESLSQDSGGGVFAQRFDNVGRGQGEFPVNTYATGFQSFADVACDRQGNFVVVWQSAGQDGSDYGIFGRRFDASGGAFGSDFQVNTQTQGRQSAPRVAAAPTGEFVVVWQTSGASGYEIVGQRFDGNGGRVGPEFPIATDTAESHRSAQVAVDDFGNFIVSWVSQANEMDAVPHASAQRFDRSGAKLGGEFSIGTGNVFSTPQIAFPRGGGFVAAWGSEFGDEDGYGVLAQRYNASGDKLGAEIPINTFTTGMQRRPSVAADRNGHFLVTWESGQDPDASSGIYGQEFDRSGARVGPEFAVNAYATGYQAASSVADDGFGFVVAWESNGQDGGGRGAFGRRQEPAAMPSAMDVHPGSGTISNLNGVLEPGETAVFEPTYSVARGTGLFGHPRVTGAFSNFTGPSGAIYLLPDDSADYGSLSIFKFLSRSTRRCYDQIGDCPIVAVAASGPRPAVHWDASLSEDLFVNGSALGGGHVWKIHLGDSFSDVPRSQLFYKKIETMLHNGVSTGCGGTKYCPDDPVHRDQMAIFIGRALAGSADSIPNTGVFEGAPYNCAPGGNSLFLDVAPIDAFCKHVHFLAALNITTGCRTAGYCPGQTVTRDAMASFIAKATVAPRGGGAVPLSYSDAMTGLSYSCDPAAPNVHFTDVPTSNAFCKQIHFLWAKGIVSGCTPTQYCPSQAVHRDAMAKFISNGFGLQLYGP